MTIPFSKEEIKRKADAAEARSRGDVNANTIDGDSAAKEFLEVALSEGEIDAEIRKLAALPERVYESSRKAALERLPEGFRGGVLDRLVKAERSKIAKADNDFLPHWKVEPWPDPVDGAALLNELRRHFNRYAVTPKHGDVVLALWPLHTWVFDCFDITPYLVVTSPTRSCGKTLVMTLLYWLCGRGKRNDSMSKAAIFRSVDRDKPTLVLDEVGWVVDQKDDRQGILCGGFERNGYVEICEGEGASINSRLYSTYGPKVFGLIGKLTPTLMDRSIEINIQRKMSREKVESLRRRDNDQHRVLRQKCLRWANDNRAALAAIEVRPPAGLDDRAFDIWEPLLSIAQLVGGDWPKLAMEAAIALSGGEDDTNEETRVELLHDIEKEFACTEHTALITKTLIDRLCADEERPWATYNKGTYNKEQRISAKQIAQLLSLFDIIPGTVHPHETGEAKSAKGYRRAWFEDAFGRYPQVSSPPLETFLPSSRPNADETGTTGHFCSRPEGEMDGSEKCEKSANHAGLDGWTAKKPVTGNDTSSDVNSGVHYPEICQHCGAPATADSPVQVCAIDGEEFLLHRHCQADWLRETSATEDLAIPEFLRRTPDAEPKS